MKRILRAAACTLCAGVLCAVLAACAPCAEPSLQEKGRPDAAVSSVRPYPRTTEYVPGDNVVYFNGTSGSTPLVCYLDLESLQAHVLCSVEGCTHSTQACPAYGGGHLFLTPDALYSYRSCDASYLELGSAPALGTLRVHALDGSESHEVAKVDDGWTLGMFAQSDTAIYGTLGSDLAMLELATGHETILQRNFTQNNYFDNYHLAQIGNDLLLPVWVGNPLEKIVFYSLSASGELTEIRRAELNTGVPYEGKYYYADKQGRIYVLDVLTGESTLFCDELQYTHPDGTVRFSGQGAMYVVSGHLMAERTTPQEMPEYASKPIRLFAIPLEGGPASEILLSDFYHTYDNPLKVRAETPAGLIVVGDRGSTTYVDTGKDGSLYSGEGSEERMALISPEDYFASNPNFQFLDFTLQPS
jgi:hypothetical protein